MSVLDLGAGSCQDRKQGAASAGLVFGVWCAGSEMSHTINFTFVRAEAASSRAVTAQGLTKPPCKGGKGSNMTEWRGPNPR